MVILANILAFIRRGSEASKTSSERVRVYACFLNEESREPNIYSRFDMKTHSRAYRTLSFVIDELLTGPLLAFGIL